MELATLCGTNACAIIYGRDGEFESWPENPTQAKAIIKNFKDLMNNPYNNAKVRDESQKKDVVVPGGEIGSCSENPTADDKGIIQKLENLMNDPYQRTTRGSNQTTEENTDSVDLRKKMEKRLLYLNRSSLTEYEEFFMQLEAKLEALNKRIVFLRKDQQYDTKSCNAEKKQLYYSEETPLFPFDLNYPLPDKAEYCLSLSSEDYNEPRRS
ncbi:hypothetical protein POM88_029597 [Heracleum sosnowskyi]|uniref:Uncharacterized protein n=1 Tax=Heracleum sosnowskyi TaxID=360622 RepID=A0AAD8HTZ3_9APIA|nr:hypothetical protein POM88_029597 [Heracleum sosnowskyi]